MYSCKTISSKKSHTHQIPQSTVTCLFLNWCKNQLPVTRKVPHILEHNIVSCSIPKIKPLQLRCKACIKKEMERIWKPIAKQQTGAVLADIKTSLELMVFKWGCIKQSNKHYPKIPKLGTKPMCLINNG